MAIITAGDLSDLYQSPFRANGSTVTLKKISETDWLLFGDLAEGDSEGFPLSDGDPYFLVEFEENGNTATILVDNPESTASISMGFGAQQTSFTVNAVPAPFIVPEGQHLAFFIETSSSYTSDFKATVVYGDGSTQEYELDSSWMVSLYDPSGIQSVLFEPKWPGVTMSGSIRAELVTPPQPQQGDFSLIVGDAGENSVGYASEINLTSRPPTGTLLKAPMGIAGEFVTRWETFINTEGSLSIWAQISRDRPYAETRDALVTFHLPGGDVVKEFTLKLLSMNYISFTSDEVVPVWVVGQTVHFSIEVL